MRCATGSTSCGTHTSISAHSTESCSRAGHKQTPGIALGVCRRRARSARYRRGCVCLLGLSELLDLLQLLGCQLAWLLAACDLRRLDLMLDGLDHLRVRKGHDVARAREVGDSG